MAVSDYHQKLNEWHLELAICRDALAFVVVQMDVSEGLESCGRICLDRLSHLVECCPFPVRDGHDQV